MPACRLIVHADDFGLTKHVNDGINRTFQHGILTSTSIMATGQAFDHAVEISAQTPSLDLGVHLTLVEEVPILPPEQIHTLVGKTDRFIENAVEFTRHLILGKIDLNEVRAELEAQIVKVMDHGLAISHLDSHQHLHVLPGVRDIVVELAKRFGIKAIRLPRERPYRYMLTWPLMPTRLSQMLVLNLMSNRVSIKGLATTDTFMGFFVGGRLSTAKLSDILNCLPANKTCELMCHPGFVDHSYSHWQYHHEEELEALCDKNIIDWLQDRDVQLISYQDLSQQASSE